MRQGAKRSEAMLGSLGKQWCETLVVSCQTGFSFIVDHGDYLGRRLGDAVNGSPVMLLAKLP